MLCAKDGYASCHIGCIGGDAWGRDSTTPDHGIGQSSMDLERGDRMSLVKDGAWRPGDDSAQNYSCSPGSGSHLVMGHGLGLVRVHTSKSIETKLTFDASITKISFCFSRTIQLFCKKRKIDCTSFRNHTLIFY